MKNILILTILLTSLSSYAGEKVSKVSKPNYKFAQRDNFALSLYAVAGTSFAAGAYSKTKQNKDYGFATIMGLAIGAMGVSGDGLHENLYE